MNPDCSVTAWFKNPLSGIFIGVPYRWNALKKRGIVRPCDRVLFANKCRP